MALSSSWATSSRTIAVASLSPARESRYTTSSQYSLTPSPSSPGSVLARRKACCERRRPTSGVQRSGFLPCGFDRIGPFLRTLSSRPGNEASCIVLSLVFKLGYFVKSLCSSLDSSRTPKGWVLFFAWASLAAAAGGGGLRSSSGGWFSRWILEQATEQLHKSDQVAACGAGQLTRRANIAGTCIWPRLCCRCRRASGAS